MIEVQYEKKGSYLKNISVRKDGQPIGGVIPSLEVDDDFRYYTDNVSIRGYIFQCNNFVFYHRSADESYCDELYLWCFDEPFDYPKNISSTDDLPNSINLPIDLNGRTGFQLMTCGTALFLPKKLEWRSAEKNKYCIQFDGRWLFEHPDGVRAAYEHLKNTTLEDDWHGLMPLLSPEHPDFTLIMKTFGQL